MIELSNLSLQMVNISQYDVDKMLDYYDSGMSDTSTSNAVALALKGLLKPGHRVRVVRDSANGGGCAHIGEHEFALPEELFDWLERAERASPVGPIAFRAALPDEWLRRSVKGKQKPGEAEQASMVA